LDTECDSVDKLATVTAETIGQPDYATITSFRAWPTPARVLAEIGGDRNRFTDARALTAFEGSALSREHPGTAS
jgi:hypothetical protein